MSPLLVAATIRLPAERGVYCQGRFGQEIESYERQKRNTGCFVVFGWPRLFCSYHPSQQNTQTGRLTSEMFQKVLVDIQEFLASV